MTAPEYLDPVRHELHQLRAKVARVQEVVDGWRSYPPNHPLPVCRTVAACKAEIAAALEETP